MPASQIVGSTFEEGLRAPHYINRRLLTAEDLKTDQQAVLARLALLGKACGYGVVEGLLVEQVAGSSTAIKIGAGLGLNRCGNPLRLARDVQLAIGPQGTTGTAVVDAGRFQDCDLTQAGPAGTTAAGAYLLTAAPVSKLEGAAPVKAAAGSLDAPACAAQWEVEGLQFKAIRLAGFDSEAGITDQSRRNRLAHWCYGSGQFPAIERDPLAFAEGYGGLASLSADDLTDCDLPLAVFYWTGSAIEFVDRWAVRRRPIRPGALTAASGMLSDRRVAEGQARFLQFQEQLDGLLKTTNGTASITAATCFPLLPPAGFLPLRLPESLLFQVAGSLVQQILQQLVQELKFISIAGMPLNAQVLKQAAVITAQTVQQTTQAGVSAETFFGPRQHTYFLVDRDEIDERLHRSWYHNAIVTASEQPIDLLIAEDDVVQLIAPALIGSVQTQLMQILVQFSAFGADLSAIPALVTTYVRRRLAILSGQVLANATLEARQPVGLFVKRIREMTPIGMQT